jgi:transposase-like protein
MRLAGRPLGYSADPGKRDAVRRMTAGGMSIERVALELGINPKTVKRWMDPEELKRRGAEAAARRAVADRVVAMARSGKGARAIARELGINPGVACGAIDRARQRGELPPPRAMASYRKKARTVAPQPPSPKRAPRIEAIADAPITIPALASMAEVDRLLGGKVAADSAAPCRSRHSPRRSGCDLAPALELDVTET